MFPVTQDYIKSRKKDGSRGLGRCMKCRRGYIWQRSKVWARLDEATCPRCKGMLWQTTSLYKGPWYEVAEKPH